jgi:hypothetical protein
MSELKYVEEGYSTPKATKYLDNAIKVEEGDMLKNEEDAEKRLHWVEKYIAKAVEAEEMGQ